MRERLTIAVASIEAFVDGKLAPTTQRLCVVAAALGDVCAALDDIDAATRAIPAIAERRIGTESGVAVLR